MKILEAVNTLMYKIALGELHMMNSRKLDSDISYNTLRYIDLISMIENCTVTKIAKLLNVSKSAVTIKVNEMLAAGLLKKTQSKEDKRVFYLEICGRTAKVYRTYDDRLFSATEILGKKYTKEECESFCKILTDLSSFFTWEDEGEIEIKNRKDNNT